MVARQLLRAASIALLAASSVFGQVVTVSDWGPAVTEPFDPAHPPADLAGGEAADATPFVEVAGAAHSGSWDGAEYVVKKVDPVTARGHTRIRIPTNADATLAGHEAGHDALNKNEYDKNARRKIDEAFKGFNGMKFKGEGATDAERQASALAKATAESDKRKLQAQDAIQAQMHTLGEKFDTLTSHGTSATTNTAEGKKQAIAERDKAPDADMQGNLPSSHDPFASGTGRAIFDAAGSRIALAGAGTQALVQQTSFAGDPLVNRGLFQIDPLVVIGLTDSGAVHLSDTSLRLIDATTGRTLMTAFLFEVAYKPSTLPDFAGMVQAYLDLPPDFTGALDNFIGSPSLDGLAQAANAGRMTTFWFFAQDDLFDANGKPVADSNGLAMIGVAVPEPGALALVAAALAGLWLARRRHPASRASSTCGHGLAPKPDRVCRCAVTTRRSRSASGFFAISVSTRRTTRANTIFGRVTQA